jgi:uncharacterized protein
MAGKAGRYELKGAAGGQFMFNLKAGNGEVILTSEVYTSKAAAKNGIASCQKNAKTDAKYDRRSSSNGKPYFVLLAANKQIIGKSAMYAARSSMERGIGSCKRNGPKAALVDITDKKK